MKIQQISLNELSSFCSKLQLLKQAKEAKEQELKELQSDIDSLEIDTIPSILAELGISKIELETGETVQVKYDLTCSISKTSNYQAFCNAVAWLENTNRADIIKSDVVVHFAKGDTKASELLAELQEQEYDATADNSVNTNSFKSVVKEALAKGEIVPLDKFNTYFQPKTTIK